MRNRVEAIKAKGFSIARDTRGEDGRDYVGGDYGKIKVGMKTLDDAVMDTNFLKSINSKVADKENVLNAINTGNLTDMREISHFFYNVSGVYKGICDYLAKMYQYDWMLVPYINDDKVKTEKILNDFYKGLTILDDFGVKKFFTDVSIKVMLNGCYYGYLTETNSGYDVQELPVGYCRSRFSQNKVSVVEFNMKYFDDAFKDVNQRLRVLDLFPKEFKKGYVLYKEGKLPAEFRGDTSGWYMLTPGAAFKFNVDSNSDYPFFISTVPALIDLEESKGLDRKKMAQQLLKIIIQKMPMDKNGELVFDVDEARVLHNNVVQMLGKAIGVDVLTTFADVEVADMADNKQSALDELQKVERNVFNEAGTTQMLFNTEGNIATKYSILEDETRIKGMIYQFEEFLNLLLAPFNKNKKKSYLRVVILPTTKYNYQELSKLYKEQMQYGASKLLPQIALGQSQSSVLAAAYFENQVLDLNSLFLPPVSSNTMSAGAQETMKTDTEEKKVGRKELPDEEKSTKTIQNQEAL